MKTAALKFIIISTVFVSFLKTDVAQAAIDSTKSSPPALNRPTTKPVASAPSRQDAPLNKSEILDIRIQDISQSASLLKRNNTIKVDYKISILISHPKDFFLQRPTDNTPLILYADEFPLDGISTIYFDNLSKQDALGTKILWPDSLWIPFLFTRDSTNKEAWRSIFHLARWNRNELSFKVSLGWDGMFPLQIASDHKRVNNTVKLQLYNIWVFIVLIAFYILFIALFIWLCHHTGLIREPDRVNKLPGPYSLSQTQLAFWTVVILGGFIYLIILTGLTDSLNDTALILLGISGGTTGIASFIDYLKKQSNIKANLPTPPKPHVTFIKDILSDGINVSMQRTQTALWNLVLGGYFIWHVITNKSMPEFTNTLLLLAGVSSALYLGSKGPENPSQVSLNEQKQNGN